MKERSKKAPSINSDNFKIEEHEVVLVIKRDYTVPNSYFPAFTISRLVEGPSGQIQRQKVFGPNTTDMVLPNLSLLAKGYLEKELL